MRTVTVSINGQDEDFEGETRDAALDKLRQRLEGLSDANLSEAEITQGFKETRTILCKEFCDQMDDMDEPWGVEIDENGCGEVRGFATREEALGFFMLCAEEKGDHWD